jgi:galactokinase
VVTDEEARTTSLCRRPAVQKAHPPPTVGGTVAWNFRFFALDYIRGVWTSAIAVLGTLLGSSLTFFFQRLTLKRTVAENRSEKRREEFAAAVAAFASVATDLRRAEFDRAKKRLERIDGPDREEARQETYRLRAEAQSAYYLIRLLSNPDTDADLVREAEDVIKRSRRITSEPHSLEETRRRSDEALDALGKVIDRANQRLRDATGIDGP